MSNFHPIFEKTKERTVPTNQLTVSQI